MLMTPEEFDAVTEYDDRFRYELIRGVLVVSPLRKFGPGAMTGSIIRPPGSGVRPALKGVAKPGTSLNLSPVDPRPGLKPAPASTGQGRGAGVAGGRGFEACRPSPGRVVPRLPACGPPPLCKSVQKKGVRPLECRRSDPFLLDALTVARFYRGVV